jgi:hypothetical protein
MIVSFPVSEVRHAISYVTQTQRHLEKIHDGRKITATSQIHTSTSISRTSDLSDHYQPYLFYHFIELIVTIISCIQTFLDIEFSVCSSKQQFRPLTSLKKWTVNQSQASLHSSFGVGGQFWMLQTPALSHRTRSAAVFLRCFRDGLDKNSISFTSKSATNGEKHVTPRISTEFLRTLTAGMHSPLWRNTFVRTDSFQCRCSHCFPSG